MANDIVDAIRSLISLGGRRRDRTAKHGYLQKHDNRPLFPGV